MSVSSRSSKPAVDVVIVGSIGIDTVETPHARRESVLGGSASYACAAASFFSRVGMVGVVGTDFPKAYHNLYKKFGVNTEGLQVVPGQTFRWSGVYEANMDNRRTLSTELNVFASFSPKLPESYRAAPYLFLANISPSLQMHVLDQMKRPRFVLLDTMDLWINTARDALRDVIRRVDMVTMNEFEARHFTGRHNLISAARQLLELGPKYVCIKKGEHGSLLFTRDSISLLPAFLIENVQDPTGAGDTFAGGFIGSLAKGGAINRKAIVRAMLYGSVAASFGVEDFSLDRLAKLKRAQLNQRVRQFQRMLAG
ncbi:MAG: PfkB family carbohydrate kinase [Kiritimatiellae bacterium]|nr:PfkB family carbohydrate kinase [Kiritimatiellia bacterium]MCO5060883.1 PfkB family carbohydrate kinase [Kiritimatiellia bacterium]MCO5069420.1 PfkB family carbohydrate kinase [Kiritimatiellia bacterium]